MAFTTKNLSDLAALAIKHGASDIHIRTGESPCLRLRGNLVEIKTKAFSAEDVLDVCKIVTESTNESVEIDELNEKDGSYEIENHCRFRYNIFQYNKNLGVILRIVNTQVPSLEELDLPALIKKIADKERGLVLVTGATGSGKSTTLAAMIDHINKTKAMHIVTIEDPIEFLHTQQKSRITQREVGIDTPSFANALRAALRQDPDAILIGEIRDIETVEIAIKAAETGHLVLATLHTTNAVNTLGRIISMFDSAQQHEVRKRLSETLEATISQRMLETVRNKIVVAQEVMTITPAIKEIILGDGELSKLSTFITNGYESGGTGTSQTFEQHVMELLTKKKITKEEALKSVDSEADFQKALLTE